MNLDEHRQRIRCQAYSIGLLLVAFCIGASGLLGWIFDIELLKKIHPSLVTMKANTAVCLMLAAVSLFLIEGRTASPLRRRISQLLAAVVAIVGLITLSEHVLGWNSGLDQLLFHESAKEAGLSFPGRMGVAASLNFSLLGISLMLLDARARRWFRVANLLVFCVIGITLLVFLYYFYDIERDQSFTYYFTIALHTVVAFFCFCAAILLARPERGVITAVLGNSPGAIVARRMWPSLLIVILMGWIVTNRNSGWYSQGLATTMFVLAVLALLAALIWWTAVSLNRTDRERSVAEGRLGVLARVSELIRTLRDPYELSYAVAETVGT
ncbi:MAG TPA: hypothetical protein VFI71_13065, partial [Pyrinomonadaceae bacterium]|nr:hypothetical protein [Pyrinomonadaceae bacterium]